MTIPATLLFFPRPVEPLISNLSAELADLFIIFRRLSLISPEFHGFRRPTITIKDGECHERLCGYCFACFVNTACVEIRVQFTLKLADSLL